MTGQFLPPVRGKESTLDRTAPGVFGLKIDFQRESERPSRVFHALAHLIEALESLDHDLAAAVDVSAKPELLLEEVEAGSITSWFRTKISRGTSPAVMQPDERSLKRYLVRGKQAVMRYTENRSHISSRDDVRALSSELSRMAQRVEGVQQLIPQQIPERKLVADLNQLGESLAHLAPGDRVSFVSDEGSVAANSGFRVDEEAVERLLTRESITNADVMIMKVKKPDYLGYSRWEFRYQEHTIEARILDEGWLERFHKGDELLRPGDCLRADVRTEVLYGFDGDVLRTRYDVVRVQAVIRIDGWEQQDFIMA